MASEESPKHFDSALNRSSFSDSSSERIHGFDNLRALAMLLGIYLHGAFAYAHPAQSFWLATDPNSSIAIDVSIWWIHLFRMSLFFFLAGYFGKLTIARRSVSYFLKHRGLRLGLPFLLFYPCLLFAMAVVIIFSLSYVQEPAGLMKWIAAASEPGGPPKSEQPWSTMHLWFLYYLLLFSALGAACHAWFPRPSWLSRLSIYQHPWLMTLAPLLLVPAVLAAGVPLPAPESFVPAWWPFAFYGLFYAAGWQLLDNETKLKSWIPYGWHLLLASVLLFLPYYACMPNLDLELLTQEKQSVPTWRLATQVLSTAYLSVMLTLASLLLGLHYLSSQNSLLRFLSDASYWIYLIHLPIVIFLQTLLIPLDQAVPWLGAVWFKLPLVLFTTISFGLGTYLVFVRYTPLGWLLHGKRSFP